MRLLIGAVAVTGIAAVALLILLGQGVFKSSTADRARRTSVGAIVDVPRLWVRKTVKVTGTAVPVDAERFVLRGRSGAIVVRPQPATVRGRVEDRERVTLVAVVDRFDRLQATELRQLIRGGRHPALEAAPTRLGDPFLSAEHVDARSAPSQ